ncbi:MAG: type II toxin-antitoxin system Phd/YefM family antitoxin [Chloroflexi bacterium]|nr:type II toxin-antitoxin system Phd/YefM family antitoxin [Chloroflexota bacterium]
MPKVYTYSDARQQFASLLEQAVRDGEVKVKRKDGQIFVIRPEKRMDSPFKVESIDLSLSTDEILEFIRESRRPQDS